MAKRASSAQMRMSAPSATSNPPPRHEPWIIATIGLVAATSGPRGVVRGTEPRSPMSAPEAKARVPAPRNTSTLMPSSASSSARPAESAPNIPAVRALRRSGLSMIAHPTGPSRSSRTVPTIGSRP